MRRKTVDVTAVRLLKQNQARWATGAADMHRYERATRTQARPTNTGVPSIALLVFPKDEPWIFIQSDPDRDKERVRGYTMTAVSQCL